MITERGDGIFELRMPPDRPLHLAVFTDQHMDGRDPLGMLRTRRHMRALVEELRPDMLAVLGDTALNPFNRGRTRAFVRLMDSFGLPWTAVLGNHEGEQPHELPRRKVIDCYKRSPRFMGSVELPDVTGHGNQAVAVLGGDGRAAQLLYFLDSGGGSAHRYIQPDQLDWLARAAGAYPGTPGVLFMHVPAWQYQQAYDALESGEATLLQGRRREAICVDGDPGQSEALAARAKELGIWAFVCGHDHSNNFDILWLGTRYIYAHYASYSRIFSDKHLRGTRGCTLFVVGPEGRTEVEQHLYDPTHWEG